MLVYSELLTDYSLKSNQAKCDRLSNKEKRLPRFALSEKNKNRPLYENRVNITSKFNSSTKTSIDTTTMMHSYRLPMFPSLFSKSENIHDHNGLRRNKMSENDDTDSNNSRITLASIVNSDDSLKQRDNEFLNRQFSFGNKSSSATIKMNYLINGEKGYNSEMNCRNSGKYDSSMNISREDIQINRGVGTREVELSRKDPQINSWKSNSSEMSNLSNRARHIDRLFGELSRKMYCLSEENGSLMDNLFKVTEHLKYFKNSLQNHQHNQLLGHLEYTNNINNFNEYSQYENSKSDNLGQRQLSPNQNMNFNPTKVRTDTVVNLQENLLSYSHPNINQERSHFTINNTNNNDGNNTNGFNTTKNNNDINTRHININNNRNTCTVKKCAETLPGYKTQINNTTEQNVQKNDDTKPHLLQSNKIPHQIFTRANRFSTINLTASLFRTASKERSRKKVA
ncbi:unnamed protein product [Heterobilharzia americana]|nr:unnamed protein product [Heterobilharzia americana]